MSYLLTRSRGRVAFCVIHTPFRSYAAKKEDQAGDPKKEIIRKALYPNNIRSRASPTGTWRPDVGSALQHAIPSVQAHHTIERGWRLHQRHLRQRREAELARKFNAMRKAMDELQQVDERLYREASKPEDPRDRSEVERRLAKSFKTTEIRTLEARIRGLFPRELRVPTDTPSREGWNYEYKPFPYPL